MSPTAAQPVEGVAPSNVFTRWMYRVGRSFTPPVGPSPTTAASSSSQGIAPAATKLGSDDDAIGFPQTTLESRECCHVGPGSRLYGVGLRKCVRICSLSALN